MAINQEIISTSWEGQQKSYIEAGMKTLLQRMLEVLESPLAANSVGSNQLTQELRDLINSIDSKVPNNRTVNNKPLSADVTIGPDDIMVGNQTLADKLDEMDDAIGQGGDTSGLESRIAALEQSLDNLTGAEDTTQIIDTFNEVIDFLANVNNNETLLGKLQQLQTQINSKANDNAVVKSISVNGTPQTKDGSGNVNISVQGQDGKSAYQVAVDNGFIGSQAEWLASLNGNDGVENGDDVVVVNNYNGVPSDIQQGQVAVLGAALGMSIGKVFNVNTQDQNNATPYRLWIGTQQQLEALNEDYEDNTIYLVGIIPTVSQRFNVTFNGGSHTSIPANTPQTVKEGSAFSVIVSPASGYTIDTATGTMVSGTLTKTNNQDGTVTFSTSAVTGAITITAVATKHIAGITVSAGTRSGNSIPLTAAVAPSGAENVTLAWSVNDTTNFGISGSGTDATLTVKSGASNSSVTITCQDTNASSDTASGTLQLTGLSYAEAPITEITDISATRTSANTLTLDATADSSTPTIEYSLVGTVPTVKQVRRWEAGDEVDGETQAEAGSDLIDVPAVVLSGNTLTYKDDCQIQVKATAGSVESDEKTINITHDNADAIWFEDEVTLAALNSNSVGSGGKVTYTQAAAVTTLKFLAGNTSIRRFREFMWFTGITGAGPNSSDKSKFNGCSNLECIGIPMGADGFRTKTAFSTQNPFYGCKLKEVHVRNLEDIFRVSHWQADGLSSFYYAGRDSSGLGLYVDNAEITGIVVPSSRTTVGAYVLAGFNRITSFTAHNEITSFGKGAVGGCTSLTSIKIGDGVTSLVDYSRLPGVTAYLTSLSSVDLGAGCSSLGEQCFRGCTGLRTLTLRYDGVVSQDNSFYEAASMSNIDLYVPASQVSAYQAASPWSGAKSINAITE